MQSTNNNKPQIIDMQMSFKHQFVIDIRTDSSVADHQWDGGKS